MDISDFLSSGYDLLSDGILLLESDRRVLFSNLAAREMMQEDRGLQLVAGKLEIDRPKGNKLKSIIKQACSSGVPTVSRYAIPSHTPGVLPLFVMLCTCRKERSDQYGFLCWGIIRDPGATGGFDQHILAEAFGLTLAEASLSLELLNGKSLKAYSREADISYNTARTHLSHLMHKCNVTSQSELMHLLMACWFDIR
ncbi:MAG: helix-turn-helix transcriptional regulator [Pseudomonadota bacterium]